MIKNELKSVFNINAKIISKIFLINYNFSFKNSFNSNHCKYFSNIIKMDNIDVKLDDKNNNINNINQIKIESEKFSMNLSLFKIEKINDFTGIYKFRHLSTNKRTVKPMVELKSCQNVKLTLGKEERYYSLINVPKLKNFKIESNTFYTCEFHMLIKENPNVPDKNKSFPVLLRKYYLYDENIKNSDNSNNFNSYEDLKSIDINSLNNKEITITFPYGILEYNEKGEFKYNNSYIKGKNIILISSGTGIAPMRQLIHNFNDELSELNYNDYNVNLIDVTNSDNSYFYQELQELFDKSYYNNKLINCKQKSENKSINILKRFYTIHDDYYGNIDHTIGIITNVIYEITNLNEDELNKSVFLLCGTINMVDKVFNLLNEKLFIKEDRICKFY